MSTPARVIGTAGHIDHGKTSLTRALTGIDTDRLKEEKERGITIELGFAHLALPSGDVVGVIDVPGHERFVRTMVAGAVGIDLVVLVVAADEGVMPQTREHLDICGLLGIRRGLVALTKSDLVDEEMRELAMLDVAEALRGSFLEGAPIIACSTKSGDGLEPLRRAIDGLLLDAPQKDPEAPLRLPMDRVFSMKGFGTVVTGTLWGGRIAVGDELEALPHGEGKPAKVRGVQVHGRLVDQAIAGQRTAINLSLPHEAVTRGDVLVRRQELQAGRLIDVHLHHLPTCRQGLGSRARVLVQLGCVQTLGKVTLFDARTLEPGGSSLAQIELDTPTVALPGDHFIVRGFALQKQHTSTLGGGVVLRTLGTRFRRSSPSLLSTLRQNEQAAPEERVLCEIERAHEAGISRQELGFRLPFSSKVIDAAIGKWLGERRAIRFDRERGGLISKSALAMLMDKTVALVAKFHEQSPLLPGIGREQLRSQIGTDAKLLHVVLEALRNTAKLVVGRDEVRLPSHSLEHKRAEGGVTELAERVRARFAAARLEPPRPAEVALELHCSPSDLVSAFSLLVDKREMVRIQDLLFHRDAVEDLRRRLVDFLTEHSQISPPEWKALCGVSRKFSIPLAEYFDAEKLTLRVGDLRKLRSRPFDKLRMSGHKDQDERS